MKFRRSYIPIFLSVVITSSASAAPDRACFSAIPAAACTSSLHATGNGPVIRLLQSRSPVGPVLAQLPTPARSFIGLKIQEVSAEIADRLGMRKARGALVVSIYGNGPANSAGIKVGDVIVDFDGHDIKETRDLARIVADTPAGKDVRVIVNRAGNEETMTVKVGTRVVGLPGAMAVGKCDRLGYALGYDNFDAAAAAALQDCARNGDKSCKVILAIQGNCASFAVDSICRARGWANGSESRLAEDLALASCARQGGRDCRVIQSICDAD